MKLKHYQEKVLTTLKDYLSALNDFKARYEKAIEFDPEMASEYNFPKRAWEHVHSNSSPSGRLGGAAFTATGIAPEFLPSAGKSPDSLLIPSR